MDSGSANVGRPCEVCRSWKRKEIENEIYSNNAISQISQRYVVSTHSLYRHIRNHAAPEIQESFRATIGMSPMTLAERMFEVANSARAIRQSADSDLVALRAGVAEVQTLQVIASRLGVTDESVHRAIEDVKTMGKVIGDLSRRHPGIGEMLVDLLAKRGADAVASELALILARHEERDIAGASEGSQ